MKTEREKRLEAALREARNAMTDIGGDLRCGAISPKKAAGQLFEAASKVNGTLSDEGSGEGEWCPSCGGQGCEDCRDTTAPPQQREAMEESHVTVTRALTYLGYLFNSALCGGYEPHQNLYKYHQAVRSILVKLQEDEYYAPPQQRDALEALRIVDRHMSGNDSYEGIWVNYPDKPEQSPASVVREALADEAAGGGDKPIAEMTAHELTVAMTRNTSPPQQRDALEAVNEWEAHALAAALLSHNPNGVRESVGIWAREIRRALTEPAVPMMYVVPEDETTEDGTQLYSLHGFPPPRADYVTIRPRSRLAAIERQVRELADEYQSEPIADELRAILDSPGQSRDMGDSDDPDVGRYR